MIDATSKDLPVVALVPQWQKICRVSLRYFTASETFERIRYNDIKCKRLNFRKFAAKATRGASQECGV